MFQAQNLSNLYRKYSGSAVADWMKNKLCMTNLFNRVMTMNNDKLLPKTFEK